MAVLVQRESEFGRFGFEGCVSVETSDTWVSHIKVTIRERFGRGESHPCDLDGWTALASVPIRTQFSVQVTRIIRSQSVVGHSQLV